MSDLALSRAVAVLTFTAFTRPIARSRLNNESSRVCQLSSATAARYFLRFSAEVFALRVLAVAFLRVGARRGASPVARGNVCVTRLKPTGFSRYSPHAARSN